MMLEGDLTWGSENTHTHRRFLLLTFEVVCVCFTSLNENRIQMYFFLLEKK